MQSPSFPVREHALINLAASLPTTPATPTITLTPITLTVPSRPVPLQLRLTLPAPTATDPTTETLPEPLPLILLSHGQGASTSLSSLHGYAPLANHWASHGFAVIQPTHLSSKTLSLPASTPGAPLFWRERVQDMKMILESLGEIEGVAGGFLRGGGAAAVGFDRGRVAVVGHSMGAHTAGVLLGMEVRDPESGEIIDSLAERDRIQAGILLAGLGDGGDDSLSEWGRANLPFHRGVGFGGMRAPCLVVVGDADESAHLTTRGWKWHADPYYLAPGPKSLLTLFGGDHCFGVSGYDAKETVGESVERVAAVQRVTTAYLRSVLCGDDEGWRGTAEALESVGSIGVVESK